MVRKSALPPYFVWRDGRPRWNPGPRLRALGHHGRDLRGADGAWLSKGAAIDAAERINAAIAEGETIIATPPDARTLSKLFDAYQASDNFRRLAPRTQKDYRDHMAILSAWSGDVPIAAITRSSITQLYGALRDGRGLTRANAILRTLRLTLFFAKDDLEWIDRNRAAKLKMPRADGRLVMWSPAEIAAFVAAADYCGRPSQGDAVILGVCTGQQRVDILTAPSFVLEQGVYRMTRRKTKRVCYIPASRPLTERIEHMRKRNAAAFPNVTFSTELVCSARGSSYAADGYYFGDEHAAVRALAAGVIHAIEDIARFMFGLPPLVRNLPFTPQPSLIGKTFADLRDTAVTMLYSETKDISRVANVTGHSLATAQAIIDRHYFVRNADLAKDAAGSFDALIAPRA